MSYYRSENLRSYTKQYFK